MKKMITRRNFLKAAGVSAAALGLPAAVLPAAPLPLPPVLPLLPAPLQRQTARSTT
jgi:hypothetical protein